MDQHTPPPHRSPANHRGASWRSCRLDPVAASAARNHGGILQELVIGIDGPWIVRLYVGQNCVH